jgi:hypothetical protein
MKRQPRDYRVTVTAYRNGAPVETHTCMVRGVTDRGIRGEAERRMRFPWLADCTMVADPPKVAS